jgi:hypothetical protein
MKIDDILTKYCPYIWSSDEIQPNISPKLGYNKSEIFWIVFATELWNVAAGNGDIVSEVVRF